MREVISSVVVSVLLVMFTGAAAQLPPEIMADRYLVQAERLMAEKDYEGALGAMKKIVALQGEHDLTLPDEFHFKYARVALAAGMIQDAIDSVSRYLVAAGREGEFYRAALRLLESAEDQLRKAAIEQAQADAAQRRSEERELRRLERERENREQAQRQIAQAASLPPDSLRSGGFAPEMVKITSGRFEYWTYQDGPNTLETVVFKRPFAIGKYEVTRGDFERFVESSRYRTEAQSDPKYGCQGEAWDSRRKNTSLRWDRPGFDQTDTHPVTCVSATDAMAYAQWLSAQTGHRYRLPSPAEWHYVLRAGSAASMLYIDGAAIDYVLHRSERPQTPVTYTGEVGSSHPNPLGIYDMLGNVGELVSGCYREGPGENVVSMYLSSTDGSAEDPRRCDDYAVNFGGSWSWRQSRWFETKPSRSKDRLDKWTYTRNSTGWIGFRLVRELDNLDEEARQ